MPPALGTNNDLFDKPDDEELDEGRSCGSSVQDGPIQDEGDTADTTVSSISSAPDATILPGRTSSVLKVRLPNWSAAFTKGTEPY